MAEVKSRFVTIKHHINGAPSESDFEIRTETISLLVGDESKELVVKNMYVSVDPYQLNRMKNLSASQAAISFASAVIPGQVYNSIFTCHRFISNVTNRLYHRRLD